MSLTNYRDVGRGGTDTEAGFQFEFYCGDCSRTWKSTYKPYRKGQFAGLIYKLAYFLGDRGSMSRTSTVVANLGASRAREAALQEALEVAEQKYVDCPGCHRTVCEECWDPRARLCEQCVRQGDGGASHGGRDDDTDRRGTRSSARADDRDASDERGGGSGGAVKCPNCSTAVTGGRFCEECGFDMAATHKSCPGCGTMCARSTRFCADCGHAF